MSKGSSSKKKKSSPKTTTTKSAETAGENPGRPMPKIPRTPQGQAPEAEKQADPDVNKAGSMESILAGMESRLVKKMDETKRSVQEVLTMAQMNSQAIEALEERVDDNREDVAKALRDMEEKLTRKMQDQVQELVRDNLKSIGFDTQLSAGDLSMLPGNVDNCASYAAAVANGPVGPSTARKTKEDRREEKFWEARSSLLLWPIESPTEAALHGFLRDKLSVDAATIEDLGEVTFKKQAITKKQRDSNIRNEYCVTFENKRIRDDIKANAANLANHRDTAGMRLAVPDHLQKEFKLLMSLSYDLKQKHADLKRNIKFDETNLSLFMDVQFKRDGPWRRIRPEQAKDAATRKMSKQTDTQDLDPAELRDLLGRSEDEDEEDP